jgi:choline dehydrogenase-like flavoprotein
MTARDFDVVVVGSGVAGALTAWRLAQAGAKVLMLEAGNTNPARSEMVGAYATAQPKSLHSPYVDKQSDAKAPGPDGPNDYYDQTDGTHPQFKSTYERRTGGSTWHWLGHTPRMLRTDFTMRTTYGPSGGDAFPQAFADWPITYDDLEPWYCEAERELGVAGSDAEWEDTFGSKRSQPFPMSMIWPSYSDRWIAERIDNRSFEGAKIQVRSTPSARNTQLYDGRPPCAGNSICVPLCPIGAKYDGFVHVRKAMGAGVKLMERSIVTRLAADADGSVHTVEVTTQDGAPPRKFTADVVVVAANAIESPRLLLISELANKSDQVGRNLMDHLSKSTFGIAPEPLFPFRGPPSTSGIESFRDGDFRSVRAGFRVSLNNDGWGRRGAPQAEIVDMVGNQGLFGSGLQKRLFQRVTRQMRLSCSVEVSPDPDNRVGLSKTLKDGLNLPRPSITFTPSKYSMDGLAQATRTMGALFDMVGATEVSLGDPTAYDGAGHIMGTCRMGADPGTSVVDPEGRAHDHRNLFIVGSSVFPTCGSPNPTLTLAALSLRTADAITRQLGLQPQVAA